MKRKNGMGRAPRRWWEEGLFQRRPEANWSVASLAFVKRRSRRRQRRLGKKQLREDWD